MNIVNETASRVQELEKRMDDHELSSTLKLLELKKEVGEVVDMTFNYLLGKIKTTAAASAVVFQGSIKLVGGTGGSVLRVNFICDDYVFSSQEVALLEGEERMVSLLSSLPSSILSEKYLKVQLVYLSGGAATFSSYHYFVWGYGIESEDAYNALPGEINGDINSLGEVTLYLVDDGEGYYYRGAPKYSGFSILDYTFLAKAKSLDGGYINLGGEETLVTFLVDNNEDLYLLQGTDLESKQLVYSGVSKVSVSSLSDGELVVAFSAGGNLYYFSYMGESLTQPVLLYTFTETITELGIVASSEGSSYLIAGLGSGKNYLFPSVSSFSSAAVEGRIGVSTNFEVI